MTKYKLIDNQNMGTFSSVVFNSKEDVRKQLAIYHSIDWSGEVDINTLSLEELLDYGEWDLSEIVKDFIYCPLCKIDEPLNYKNWMSTHIWSCSNCPFLSLEYYSSDDIKSLQDYLHFN